MKPVRTWIMIANGARARIVANAGPGHGVTALEGMEFEDESLKTSEIVTDRPGRTHDSTGPGRHALSQGTDPHRERERAFAKTLASMLDAHCSKNSYDRLILTAAPQTLGDLRDALSSPVKAKVFAEKAKDLTQIPNSCLPAHLADISVL